MVVEEKTIESTVDAKIYQDMTTMVPPESISVPLILHGILEQVEAHVSNAQSKVPPPTDHDDDVGRYLREKLMGLSMTKEQEKVNGIHRPSARSMHHFCLRIGDGESRSQVALRSSERIGTRDDLPWR